MKIQQATTAYGIPFFMVESSDHITGATGLTPTVTISKNCGSFATPAGTVAEIGHGWYQIEGNATDNATLGALLVHAEASGADPSDTAHEVVIENLASAVIATVTNLTNAPTAGDLTATMKASVATASATGAAAAITAAEPIEASLTGDLTSTMKTSVTTAATAATPSVNVAKINTHTVGGDGTTTPFHT